MIRIEELTYSVASKYLYKDISFTLEEGSHCALIGSNGAGKSTLAHMLVHPEEYIYDGRITREESCRVGYAGQYAAEDRNRDCTVLEYLSESFIRVQEQIAAVCEEMADTENLDDAFEKYQQLIDLNQAMDGDNYEANIHRQLYTGDLLNVKSTELSKVSGGEYKVLQIIREMLLSPDLLILDEPDAFLDYRNQNNLCRLINGYKGTILVITHNRYLLNHCFNKILHLEGTAIREYNGGYTEYRCKQLKEKLELKKQHIEEQEEIERTEEMVERMRKRATLMVNPALGRTVNAKQSQLDRLISRQIDEPFLELREPDITLPELAEKNQDGDNKEHPVLTVSDYSAAFDECILEHVNFRINAGEKVAIVGANGAGKTTLVHDIVADSNPAIHIDENISRACLSQVFNRNFNNKETVYGFLQDKDYGGEDSIKRHLRKYCLNHIDIHEKISNLSVGEQNLLQIAALENSGAELLILDEPTSHLDVYSQTALEEAIKEYRGTVLVISHDFYLVADCMDYVLLIENNTIRRMKAAKFRKMVYDRYFDQKYLDGDRKKKELERDIMRAYKKGDIEKVEKLCEKLEE